MTFPRPKYGAQDFLAKTSLWREHGRELGLKGKDLDSFIDSLIFLAGVFPHLSFSKTSQVFLIRTKEEILESSFKRWPNSGMAWGGVCLTAAISECPSHAKESTLLDVITTQDVPLRYFLSPNAAQGILRRVESQGRRLFPPLWNALKDLSMENTTDEQGNKIL